MHTLHIQQLHNYMRPGSLRSCFTSLLTSLLLCKSHPNQWCPAPEQYLLACLKYKKYDGELMEMMLASYLAEKTEERSLLTPALLFVVIKELYSYYIFLHMLLYSCRLAFSGASVIIAWQKYKFIKCFNKTHWSMLYCFDLLLFIEEWRIDKIKSWSTVEILVNHSK